MVPRGLGRTSLRVAPVGLGTVKLGRNRGVKYPEPFSLPADLEVEALLEAALELGVNLLDTAPAYGTAEERLAPFLARHRDQVVLCTKVGETFDPEGGSTFDFTRKGIQRSVERSLHRLGTDRIDILLLHSHGRDLEILRHSDAVETLQRLQQSGQVRATGISAKTASGIRAAAEGLDVVMAPFSLRDDSLGPALAEVCRAGLGVLVIKSLESGHLQGVSAAERVRGVLAQPFVDALVVGTLSPAHLAEVVTAARAERPGAAAPGGEGSPGR